MTTMRSSVTLLVLAALLTGLVSCGDGERPRRRGPKNYIEYKIAEGQASGDTEDAGTGLATDDGDFGPESGTMPTTSSDDIMAGRGIPNAGSIRGKITYNGDVPKRKKENISKDPWCDDKHEVYSEEVLVHEGGAIENVTVWVSRGFNRFDFETPSSSVLLDQDGCKYVPHILTMMARQELKVRNSDATTHNYHFTGRANDEINKTQNKPTTDSVLDLVNPELTGMFRCDVHGWMSAPVRIFAHPYFAVTDEKGSFEIKGLPPGTYEVSFLHERASINAAPQTVVVAGGAAAEISLEMVSAN